MELNPPPPRRNGKRPKNSHPAHPRKKTVSLPLNLRPTAPAPKPSASRATADWRTVLDALRGAQRGDFAVRLSEDSGNPLTDKVAQAFNQLMEMNDDTTNEVIRIGRVVGREGRMTERATVPNARGGWGRKIDAINALIADLVQPTTEVARVISAVAAGDFTQKMDLEIEGSPVKGEYLRIGKTVNAMVDQLSSFAAEVTRVAKEVGTDGNLGGQAKVKGVSGVWKDLTDSVNLLANNLTAQVRNVAEVTTSVAQGDLSKKITVDAKGEVLALKNTINTMVDQLNSFAAEVRRVAREVGTEGKLGGQADVKGVSGIWRDLTDNVNFMASNLTAQVRGIVKVVTAVANGDLTQRFKIDAKGEIAALTDTINNMTDTLGVFAEQVTDVARTVGVEGKLGAQADVPGVAGTWKSLTDNVNLLANNLTAQVRNIAEVTTAVAKGDLSKKISVDAKGEMLELKNTVNTMVDQLNSFAAEVTRVAKEVGTEGKLGGQAVVKGVSGVWEDLTNNVNLMGSNLTTQVRGIVRVVTAVANGDLSQKLVVDAKGEMAGLADTLNSMTKTLGIFAQQVTTVARTVGVEGKLGAQADVPGVAGTWKDLTDNVNLLAGNLTDQVRNIAKVTTAVANGDLSQKISVHVQGEILELKNTINTMVDQLRSFASEVTRVAKEVGTEGKLGGQADVKGVSGTWKDLTDNVNFMASNLTNQVRNIALVTTAVANGDLSKKITVDVKGEILELKNTINMMVDQLNSFASEVSRVAREVGTDGNLGGQAQVKGAAGVWADLTNNVNQLAANLTAQVRAISSVATGVTKGDLTRYIDVEARGEVAQLKDNINQMITNLKDTTQKNTEQDWLKTNLARFSSMLQGLKDLQTVSRLIMSELTPLVSAHLGAFFLLDSEGGVPSFNLTSSYAYRERRNMSNHFRIGEGLVGQCALEKKTILLTEVPDDYLKITSGLGERAPINIVVLPVLFEGEVKAVIELASFHPFSPIHQLFLDQLTENLGVVLNMIGANMRTEELLEQSQSLTQELQSQSKELTEQQEELKRSNAELEKQALELEDKAKLLVEQNRKVAVKNQEVEAARIALEEKARQLSLISKYKSEFLANMSHELRTPLNSLLILAKLLSENSEGNLNPKQVEYARTIYTSGGDLLVLINEILDLTKVEAGKMHLEPREVPLSEVAEFAERSFRPLATQKGLQFKVEALPQAPGWIRTDPLRLQQVLNNLLGNAFKFTDSGGVGLRVFEAPPTALSYSPVGRGRVVAFEVSDTGIGIPADKHQIIFEAFQQADGTTSRKYGGTGLGLSISREIARLLAGEIQVSSTVGKGSTFTLYLPERYVGPDVASPEDAPVSSARPLEEPPTPAPQTVAVEDDRAEVASGDRLLLVIEDDPRFARIITEMARERGFKVVVAKQGDTGLALANDLVPDAITLDIQLPVLDGWQVLERLKRNPRTRHIPVHVISVVEHNRKAASLGAFAYLEKPVSKEKLEAAFAHLSQFLDRKMRMLLVVEDNPEEQKSMVECLSEGSDLQVTALGSAEEALFKLEHEQFDCMVVDLILPGLDGGRLIEQVKTHPRHRDMPIVVFTAKELSRPEEKKLRTYAESVIVKLDPHAPDRLLYDTAIFLHRIQERLPPRTRSAVEKFSREQVTLAGKKVLIIDDDVRNIFALTSVLEGQKMKVIYAEDGKTGEQLLASNPDIDVILMDIMMPEVDGYQMLEAIRKNPRHKALPIIAVTARALKEDREKCVAAGATDYLAKPVDPDRLVELVRLCTGDQPRPVELS